MVFSLSLNFLFFFSSRRRHTRCSRDWSSDVCSSDLDRSRTVGFESPCAGQVLIDLLDGACAGQHDVDARSRIHPCKGQRGERETGALRDWAQSFDHLLPPCEFRSLEPIDRAAVIAGRKYRGGGSAVLAGKQPRCQRPVCQKSQSLLLARRDLALFRVAVEQVVRTLVGNDRSDFCRALDLQVRRVAQSNGARVALLLELVELLELRFPPGQRLVQL